MSITIKRITKDDVLELQRISRITFKETFGKDNTVENMEQYLNEAYDKDKLIKEIENPESEFYFSLLDGKVGGYLKLNVGEAQSEREADNALEIERIYILNEFKRHGLGTKLMEFSIERAEQQKKSAMWLGVWEFNYYAQKFYEHFGFSKIGQHVFQLGEDPQTDYIFLRKM